MPVPFSDLSAKKRRPVLVLSATGHNRKSADVIVAAITSNQSSGGAGVRISEADLETGKLPVESLVRADKVYTLSRSIVMKRLGRLTLERFGEVLECLDRVLGRV